MRLIAGDIIKFHDDLSGYHDSRRHDFEGELAIVSTWWGWDMFYICGCELLFDMRDVHLINISIDDLSEDEQIRLVQLKLAQ